MLSDYCIHFGATVTLRAEGEAAECSDAAVDLGEVRAAGAALL